MYKIVAAGIIYFRMLFWNYAGVTELNYQNFCGVVITALLAAGLDTISSKK